MDVKSGTALITITMVLGVLMDGIDGSLVNVALPSIAYSFGTDTSVVSWVTISYYLTMAGFLLPFGRVASAGHIRQVFIFGFAVFTITSLVCGLAPSLQVLIIARLLQGLGAAALAAVAPMICVKMLPIEHLGRSIGILTVALSTGFALGPVVGGFVLEYATWHWIFLINIPIGVAGVVLGAISLPREETERIHVDYLGSLLFFVAIALGVIALERMSYPEDSLFCIVAGVATILLIIAFGIVSRRSDHPLLDVRMFRIRDLDFTIVSFAIINMVYMGALYILPFYMSKEMGLSSLISGAVLLIPSAITLAMSIPVGNYSDRHGRRTFSILSTVVGLVYFIILMFIEPEMGIAPLIAAVVFMGLNWGFCGAAAGSRIVDHVPEGEKDIGSSLMNFVMYIACSVGTALFASILTLGGGSGGVPIEDMTSAAFMDGMELSMLVGVVLTTVALVLAYVVREKPLD